MKTINHGVGAYGPGVQIGPAKWRHYDLIVVTRGSVVVRCDERDFLCETGSALLIPPNFMFTGSSGDTGCVIWVQHFSLGRKEKAISLPLRPEVWFGAAHREWSRTLLQEIHSRYEDSGERSSELPHLLILLLMALQKNRLPAGRKASASTEKINDLITWLGTQSHPLPSIVDLAKKVGWSQSHFRAEFHKHLGCSAGFYLREMRLREAGRLLQGSTLPIKAIAIKLGYSDIVAFHRAFLSFHGQTPARFGAQARRVV